MTLVLQIPVPPTPPPGPEAVFITSGPPDAALIATTLIIGMIVVGVILFPLIRAFARRLEGRNPGGAESSVLEGRVAELEHRLAEAEERIDFNERMLSQRETLSLPRDKAD
ncbi:MAG: hypothetical protein ABJB33_06855 [Gemmatimonadota bacterium]